MTSNKKAPKLQPQLNYRRAQPTLKRLIAHINHTSNKRITDANHITLQHTTIHSLTVSPQKGNRNINTKKKKKNLRNSSKHQNAPSTEIKSQNKTAKVQQQEKKRANVVNNPKYENNSSTNTKGKKYNSKHRKDQM